jgi:hypothetical protein
MFLSARTPYTKLERTHRELPESTNLQTKEISFNLIDKRSDKDIIGCKGDVYNVCWECLFMLSKAANREVVLGGYDRERLLIEPFSFI